MNYNEFIDEIVRLVQARMGDNFMVTSKKIIKNNSITLESLIIKENTCQVAPSIYLDSFYYSYKEGREISDIVDNIVDLYSKAIQGDICKSQIDFSVEAIKNRVFFRLVNLEKNREMLQDSLYERVNDLAAVYYYYVNDDRESFASARLMKGYCEKLGINQEELRDIALENTRKMFPAVIRPIQEVLLGAIRQKKTIMENAGVKEKTGEFKWLEELLENLEEIDDTDSEYYKMYCVSNNTGLNGATCLIYEGLLDEYYKMLGEDFYILPSSIHEVLLMPASQCDDYRFLEDMVRQVNANELDPMEFLSNTVYHYPFDRFYV